MGMKLPIAATSIVCSACVAVSVAAPTVDLPEKAVKIEAARSVTQEYKLLAVTDPVNGAVTLFALSLETSARSTSSSSTTCSARSAR